MSNDYIGDAEEIVKRLKSNKSLPTTSQLRKFLSAVNSINNKISLFCAKTADSPAELPADIKNEIQYLRIKLAYQAGKEQKVKSFIDESEILDRIKGISSSRDKYLDFSRFIEAFVAYHKYHGGGE